MLRSSGSLSNLKYDMQEHSRELISEVAVEGTDCVRSTDEE